VIYVILVTFFGGYLGVSHILDTLKKFFFGDVRDVGVKYRSSRPRRCGPRGGVAARSAGWPSPSVHRFLSTLIHRFLWITQKLRLTYS
jgi:hypothetical protein